MRLRPQVPILPTFGFVQLQKVLLEVVLSIKRQSSKFAYSIFKFKAAVSALLRLPSIKTIGVLFDVLTMKLILGGLEICAKHREAVEKSASLQTLRDKIMIHENYLDYVHVKLHVSRNNEKRIDNEIERLDWLGIQRMEIATASCQNHAMGHCRNVICRIVHAMEERCDPRKDPAWWIDFVTSKTPKDIEWRAKTNVLQLQQGDPPCHLDISDLRTKLSVEIPNALILDDIFGIVHRRKVYKGDEYAHEEEVLSYAEED